MNLYNGKKLRNSTRKVILPFSLSIDGTQELLTCEKLLNIISGKRAVFLGSWKNQDVVAKLFFQTLKMSRHIRLEATGIQALLKAGILTPDLLFTGKTADKKASVLIFKYIYPSKEVGELWNITQDLKVKRNLIGKLMVILAKMHQAGIKHLDLHLNNFLIKKDEIYTIDGTSIRRNKNSLPLKMEDRIDNLALLFAQFTLPDYFIVNDLYAEYVKISGFKDTSNFYEKLQRKIKRWRRWRIKNYLKLNLKEYSELICRKSFTRFMLCMRAYDTPAMTAFLGNPDKRFNDPKSVFLKKGNSSTVIRIKIGNHDLVVKRYNIKNIRHRLRRFLRHSRATHSWKSAHLLLLLGIATPAPVAMLENRFGYFRGKAYFVYEHVEGPNAIDFFSNGGLQQKRDVAKHILDIFKILAIAKISHQDTKGTNIIIHQNHPVLLDLDAMCMHISHRSFERAHRRDISIFLENWKTFPQVDAMFKDLLDTR
jgi:tRNA A-37 threonylcarbamoyl transferase component Bud32